jgi:DHA2 family multidrug resistance protein
MFLAPVSAPLQVVLEKGEIRTGFQTWWITALAFVTIISAICFVWRETSIDFPVVNFKILRHRSFAIGIFTSLCWGLPYTGSVRLSSRYSVRTCWDSRPNRRG